MLLLFRNTRWFGIKLKGPTSQRRMEEKLDEEEKRQDFFKDYYTRTNAFYKNGFTEAELKDANPMVRRAFSLENATPKQILKYRMGEAIKKYQHNLLDHGSAAVQCAVASERIILMMNHVKKYPRDKNAGRALTVAIQKRRKMLDYCMRTDYNRYHWICVDYGIPLQPSKNALHKDHWFRINSHYGY